ncbi:MAG: sulfotransferase [Rubrivivax sp.]
MNPAQSQALRRAAALLSPTVGTTDPLMAGMLLLDLARSAPGHAEVLRWRGIRHLQLAEWAPAVDCLQQAAEQRPNDFQLLHLLGQVQDPAGASAAALQSLRSAAQLATAAAEQFSLSTTFDAQGHYDDALAAIDRALQLDPAQPVFLLQRSRCHKALGHANEAAADCRTLIARSQLVARAWFALVDLKTVPLSDAELQQLQLLAAQTNLARDDRSFLDFALGKALEDAQQHAAAFAAFNRANRAAAAAEPWNAEHLARMVEDTGAAFAAGRARVADAEQGREMIFLVGLPRSGTTLVEQVLASHSQVEGASELPYLQQVIDAESQRRGRVFPDWVADATPADWTRLGQHYLQLSARWREHKPICTDKLPENWLLAGAVVSMLPGARIVDCRRDPVETCWSCYKQLFGPGRVGFSYDLDALANYWQAYDKLCRQWAGQFPQQFRVQRYGALVRDADAQIRELLAFCGLDFEPACLRFHTAQRAIRTPSALQVRQPLGRASTPAAGYGALLDPLRGRLTAAGAYSGPSS